MADPFPNIQLPSRPFTRKPFLPKIRTEFEDGSVQSRNRQTAMRYRYEMSWPAMSQTDYEALEEHFEETGGQVFTMTDPVDGITRYLRYSEDEIDADVIRAGLLRVRIRVEEA